MNRCSVYASELGHMVPPSSVWCPCPHHATNVVLLYGLGYNRSEVIFMYDQAGPGAACTWTCASRLHDLVVFVAVSVDCCWVPAVASYPCAVECSVQCPWPRSCEPTPVRLVGH